MVTAAVNVLPAPLHERTATDRWWAMASRICFCLCQGLTPRVLQGEIDGVFADVPLVWDVASLAGGTGFRAASDRMMLLGFGSGFCGPRVRGLLGNEQVRVLSSRTFTLTLGV